MAKKTKADIIRTALEALSDSRGVDPATITFQDVNDFARKNFRQNIVYATYWGARRAFLDELPKQQPFIAEEEAEVERRGEKEANPLDNGVITLVQEAKSLVAKMGKEQAKALIDLL